MSRAAPRAWWLTAGGETCAFCEQDYHWEAEVRCRRCDAPGCLVCVTVAWRRRDALCPRCRAAQGD